MFNFPPPAKPAHVPASSALGPAAALKTYGQTGGALDRWLERGGGSGTAAWGSVKAPTPAAQAQQRRPPRREGAALVAALGVWVVYQHYRGFGGAAALILTIPLLCWLMEARRLGRTDAVTAVSCLVWGALVGPLLALAEMLFGIALALSCFGQDTTMMMLRSASSPGASAATTTTTTTTTKPAFSVTIPYTPPATFSERLFREIRYTHSSMLFSVVYSLVMAGFVEEMFKMAVSLHSPAHVPRSSRPRSQRAYAVIVSGVGLGLAFAESALASTNLAPGAATRYAAERVLTAFPIHAACGALSGLRWHHFHVVERRMVVTALLLALAPSSAMHGVYDLGLILLTQLSAATRVQRFLFGVSMAAASVWAVFRAIRNSLAAASSNGSGGGGSAHAYANGMGMGSGLGLGGYDDESGRGSVYSSVVAKAALSSAASVSSQPSQSGPFAYAYPTGYSRW